MTSVLQLLELSALLGDASVEVVDQQPPVRFEELWSASQRTAGVIHREVGAGEAVAAILTTEMAAIQCVFATWLAGRRLVSLPTPSRGMDLGEYAQLVQRACEQTGATLVLSGEQAAALLGGPEIRSSSFSKLTAQVGPPRAQDGGDLVQFSSGTTAFPKGIRLSLEAVGENVEAIRERVELTESDLVCSWLPLSHDMGFIGALVVSLCAGADCVLLPPESFLARPASWLEACGRRGATVSASPTFGLDLAARAVHGRAGLDLRALRCVIVGAEEVRPETLRAFARSTEAAGFAAEALCPAYGMAEVGLAVSIVAPRAGWSSVSLDADALGEGRWRGATSGRSRELVSNGPPLRGIEVEQSATGDESVGRLRIRADSLLSEYVGRGSPLDPDGWLTTGDVGSLHEGEVFVVSRLGDTIRVAGRYLYPEEIERISHAFDAVRAGCCAAVADGQGRYALVAEPSSRVAEAAGLTSTAIRMRAWLTRQMRTAPSSIVFVERGSLPKTPSGKLKRPLIADALQAQSLQVLGGLGPAAQEAAP